MNINYRLLKRSQREEPNEKNDGHAFATMEEVALFAWEEKAYTLSYPYIDWIID